MKIERLPEHVLVTVTIIGGIAFALYCGHLAGGGQSKGVGVVLGAVAAVAIILIMRTRIWLLIPLCLPLGGQLVFLPLPFSVANLAILFVFPVFLAFYALKVIRKKPKIGGLDLLLFANLLYLASVYIRNPVGTEALGSAKVGGRPYVDVIVAVLAYWILVRAHISESLARKFPFLLIFGNLLSGALNFIALGFPSVVPLVSRIYSGIYADAYDAQDVSQSGGSPDETRLQFLSPLGSTLLGFLTARFSPGTLVNPLYLGRFALTMLSFVFVLKSGHRVTIPNIAMLFCLATYFRKGILDLVKVAVFGTVLLSMVLVLHGRLFELPIPAQRALSFLPGRWDPSVVGDARGSSEWRFEMWKIALTTNRYIANKWLGDGFGFTAAQLQQMSTSLDPAESQENMLVSGNFHSGPVSTIRFVGYVGLAMFFPLLIGISFYAWRLIRRAKGTPYFFLSLFVGLPLIYQPFSFVFIFGAFQNAIVGAIISLAFLKLLEDSMDSAPAPVLAGKSQLSPPRPLGRVRTLVPAGFR